MFKRVQNELGRINSLPSVLSDGDMYYMQVYSSHLWVAKGDAHGLKRFDSLAQVFKYLQGITA